MDDTKENLWIEVWRKRNRWVKGIIIVLIIMSVLICFLLLNTYIEIDPMTPVVVFFFVIILVLFILVVLIMGVTLLIGHFQLEKKLMESDPEAPSPDESGKTFDDWEPATNFPPMVERMDLSDVDKKGGFSRAWEGKDIARKKRSGKSG